MDRKVFFCALLMLLASALSAQDLVDHRSVQFATHGTDFWLSIPRTRGGLNQNNYMLGVVAQHDCNVTVSNPRLNYSETFHVLSHNEINLYLDTIIFLPLPSVALEYEDLIDTTLLQHTFDEDMSSQPAYLPQNHSIHVTSTDTIALFSMVYSLGCFETTNILPTEMLRDEYVVQTYPSYSVRGSNGIRAAYLSYGFFDIVATEDDTEVDIILSDRDWMNRHRGDTVTITLHAGQLYHIEQAPIRYKYWNQTGYPPQKVVSLSNSFHPHFVIIDTFRTDLSGTHIKARDCKRINVIEGATRVNIPDESAAAGDIVFDQSIPIRYAGKEFLVPNITFSDTDYLRFTALVDNTDITIVDNAHPGASYTLHLNAYQTDWFQMEDNEGPFYITSTQPIIVKDYSMGNNYLRGYYGDPAVITIIPTKWWHSGPINNHTLHFVDHLHNRYSGFNATHLFCRTEDVPYMTIDYYHVDTFFHAIENTPYSYAFFPYTSQYNSIGIHHINSGNHQAFFMAIQDEPGYGNHGIFNMSHLQPGSCFLEVDGRPSELLDPDSVRCIFDPVSFHGWGQYPADSIHWEFGDGTVLHFPYDNGQYVTHTYTDTGHYRAKCIISYRDESTEDCLAGRSCFTRPSDTMYAPLFIFRTYDSLISVRLCEGSYTFRDQVYDYTDTFYYRQFWSASGCDSLWTIALVTCPHCTYDSDTIAPTDLPWTYNDIIFRSAEVGYPVHLDIGDDCDSIIYYTLVVMKHWGEPPLDSTIIMVPNIFTPDLETNNQFRIVANKFITTAEVAIFDRHGVRVAQFDGLTNYWDGTCDGRPLPMGAYVYLVRYIDTDDRGWKTVKGTVTLVR